MQFKAYLRLLIREIERIEREHEQTPEEAMNDLARLRQELLENVQG